MLCVLLLFTSTVAALEHLIPGEIKHDDFYAAIYRLSKTESLRHILEIGSSSGEGSTEAFVRGIVENPSKPMLYCMELSKTRFQALQQRYGHNTQIKCYRVSSVPLSAFPSEAEITNFYNTTTTTLHQYGCQTVLGWLRQDIDYVKNANVSQHGIELIKADNDIEHFDMVLIDGSEFTGKPEFQLIYGARYILLDDIMAYKNYANYHQLLNDPCYELMEVNERLRNGYAIFRKK